MTATTRLRPSAAPHTEMVRVMIGMGVCDKDIVVDVNRTSMVNSKSIIVSIHIRARMRCFCCIERLMVVIMRASVRTVLVNSIIGA